uniref:Uncharacterized protein n=1 Tax=Tanacetum cinerariifolium TaxID=118510 RepID=A0A699GMT6_TANCI|nr:hypothetical protein [Tanacetum cinerariifolium]
MNSYLLCGGTDHNKRTCTGMFKDQDEVVVDHDEVVQEKVVTRKHFTSYLDTRIKVEKRRKERKKFRERNKREKTRLVHFGLSNRRLEQTATYSISTNSE